MAPPHGWEMCACGKTAMVWLEMRSQKALLFEKRSKNSSTLAYRLYQYGTLQKQKFFGSFLQKNAFFLCGRVRSTKLATCAPLVPSTPCVPVWMQDSHKFMVTGGQSSASRVCSHETQLHISRCAIILCGRPQSVPACGIWLPPGRAISPRR